MAYRQNDSQSRNDRIRFELMERIGVLSRKDNGWTREVNIVAWNDNPGKVDIREWDPDHKRMTRGVTLFEDEAEKLTKVLARRYGLRLSERETRTFAEQVNRSPDTQRRRRQQGCIQNRHMTRRQLPYLQPKRQRRLRKNLQRRSRKKPQRWLMGELPPPGHRPCFRYTCSL